MILRRAVAFLALSFACLPSVRAADPKNDYLSALVAENAANDLLKKVQAKAAAGTTSAEALAPEIKELDENIKLFAEDKETAARFAYLKATVYGAVIGDLKRARELLLALKRDYAGTEYANQVDQNLAALARGEKRNAALADLKPVADQIMTKARGGSTDAAAYAPEFAKLDALVKKYSANAEAASTIAMVKAKVYGGVLNQPAKARELLTAIIAKYPDTDAATNAKAILEQLDQPAGNEAPPKPGP